MSLHPYRTIGTVIGIGLVSGALIWGGQSFTASYAGNVSSPAAMPVAVTAPANGFTEIAKQVTPAVVNITTVMTEKVQRNYLFLTNSETEWKSSLANHSGLAAVGRRTLLNIEGPGEDKGRASSFPLMDIS